MKGKKSAIFREDYCFFLRGSDSFDKFYNKYLLFAATCLVQPLVGLELECQCLEQLVNVESSGRCSTVK